MLKKVIDISREIYNGMLIWSGDPEVDIENFKSIDRGSSANVGAIYMGLHSGTHIDAPYHFINSGERLEDVELDRFFGIAKVFEITDKISIREEHLVSLDIKEGDRVLFRTSNSEKEEHEFIEGYIYLDESAAKYLAKKMVASVGIDFLTIDGKGVLNHPAHSILLSSGIPIIEGIRLSGVAEGEYLLSALPLNIIGVEASPVRAVLFEI